MKKFKYQRYDYSILSHYVKNINDYINIPKDYIMKSVKVEDGVIYMNIDFSSNELTIQFNINDLTADET